MAVGLCMDRAGYQSPIWDWMAIIGASAFLGIMVMILTDNIYSRFPLIVTVSKNRFLYPVSAILFIVGFTMLGEGRCISALGCLFAIFAVMILYSSTLEKNQR